ncbi:hypothetical protein GLA29479_5053 [Lysobacter antibioticus]|nr:hypothetical protein GLA29479_5053 [Lysobacter antibioticus]
MPRAQGANAFASHRIREPAGWIRDSLAGIARWLNESLARTRFA